MGSNLLLPSPIIPSNPKTIPARAACSTDVGFGRRFALNWSEPPWLARVPTRRSSTNGSGLQIARNRLDSSPNGRIPISLRLVQLHKKSFSRRKRPEDPSALCPIGGTVWSLICLLEELHKSSMLVADEANEHRIFWDLTEPLISLSLHVFSTSPSLLLEILALIAGFFVLSVDRCVVETVSSAFDLEMLEPATSSASGMSGNSMASTGASLEIGDCWSWADAGILADSERVELHYQQKDNIQRRSHYELMILREKRPNSLLLSNYAQFLCQFEREIDRAQEYFKLALMSEPVDGEVSNKYAKFLWHERGDLAGAEEMFLKAIEADPTCSYHQSSYANFLFLTGGDETCYPVDHCGPASVCY
ncbi:hypothetical protein KSP40_PGU002410 [Platanthera guangdongensis]|uniref:Uncharacterized protein n=1 Tax=Platanthera guangdongensis TaxID=2320717 RepID=A0ABR2LJE9_9ASPA